MSPHTTSIYTLSLHDALPIFERTIGIAIVFQRFPGAGDRPFLRYVHSIGNSGRNRQAPLHRIPRILAYPTDRKSTRLNSSHRCISYAVFCLKKKKATDEAGEL